MEGGGKPKLRQGQHNSFGTGPAGDTRLQLNNLNRAVARSPVIFT
jgi:hypothetical protein